jgi:hypothetical protein
LLLVSVLGASALAPRLAVAQPGIPESDATRNAARELARQGLELMNQSKFAEAEDLFRRAYELVPAPTVAVLRGRALDKLDKLVEAAESYEAARRAARDPGAPDAFRDAGREAEHLLDQLKPQIPQLTVVVSGAPASLEGLAVKLDDRVVPAPLVGVKQPVNPGQHFVTVAVDDTVHDTRWVRLARAQQVRVLMRVEISKQAKTPPKEPVEPRSTGQRGRATLGWMSVGVGTAGFLTGLGAGLVMLNHKSELDEQCRPECPEELGSDLKAFRRARTISAMGYGVGFLGVGLGTGFLLSSRNAPRARGAAHATGAALAVVWSDAGPVLSVSGWLPEARRRAGVSAP